ncbi:hypothetical protein F3K37_36715 [Streptomyces sp. LBUM 1477]|nr:hypothetical protein [Streptomyces sp. LBUM 1477]
MMGRLEPVVTRVPRARRQRLLLTSRRHIDLLRVCSARSPSASADPSEPTRARPARRRGPRPAARVSVYSRHHRHTTAPRTVPPRHRALVRPRPRTRGDTCPPCPSTP